MVADQKTADVLAELARAGFTPARTDGSHTWWKHPTGIGVSVPDGHRTISPGVYRKIKRVISDADERSST